ncbi:MAG: TetR/AcrR family transcriptional regulator [Clostridia bacterium]|nr:TetR/AcrR family transcriptional regulator [Clostridia bacterium]
MNQKFFDVKKEKQDSIINAALKVFGENGYKRASTDVIVKQAGISKGLLFHYFISKQGLFSFIYDYSVRFMTLEVNQTVKKDETDFFELQKQIEQAKTRVMKNYPYMQQFFDSLKFENHPDALSALTQDDKQNAIKELYADFYQQADLTKFKEHVDVSYIRNMIEWCSAGFMKEAFWGNDPDIDAMSSEFSNYLKMLRDNLYRPEYLTEDHPT